MGRLGVILMVVGALLGFTASPWWFILALVGLVLLLVSLPSSSSSGRPSRSSDGGDFDFSSDSDD